MEALLENPRKAMVTEIPNSYLKCEDLSKPIAYLAIWLYEKNNLYSKEFGDDLEKFEEIYDAIMLEYFGRVVGKQTNKLTKFFILSDTQPLKVQSLRVFIK